MIGIDIVDIENFSKKANEDFLKKIFTENEFSYAFNKKNNMQSFAGIFAAKEAVLKACGLNLAYIIRKKVEIRHENTEPTAYLNDKIINGHISISAGMCFILAPKSISNILQIKANEQIINEIDCENFYYSDKILNQILKLLEEKDILVIGPGMGKGKDLNKLIASIIDKTDLDILIDADGLNAISQDLTILDSKNNIIITPHLAEFARLTDLSIDKIKSDEENIARNFAKKYKLVLVLKSNHTIVTDGEHFYKNNIGNPGMATDIISSLPEAIKILR